MNLLTPEPRSTWSKDLARGLSHPASRAARQARIADYQAGARDARADFNQALALLRQTLRSSEQLTQLLATTASTLAQHHGQSSHLADAIERLDALHDALEVSA